MEKSGWAHVRIAMLYVAQACNLSLDAAIKCACDSSNALSCQIACAAKTFVLVHVGLGVAVSAVSLVFMSLPAAMCRLR